MPDPVPPAAPPAPPAPAPPAAPLAAPPAPSAPGGNEPGPVPYQRFAEVNGRVSTLEAENARLQAQITGHQQIVTQQMQDQAAKLGAERQLHVALARAGVTSDSYMDYLTSQYRALGPQAPTISAWVESQRSAMPAFFSSAASAQQAPAAPPVAAPAPVATPAQPPPAAPPPAVPPAPPPAARGNPAAGTVGALPNPPTQDAPLTQELIDSMDLATYQRRLPEIRKFMQEQRR